MKPLPTLATAALLAVTPFLPAQAQTPYPLTLDNCGYAVTIAAPPQRVVALKSTATEMLLALGLRERIVGIGFQDGPVPDIWAWQAAGLTVLADRLPSQEVVLAQSPDLVYAGWESAFAADGAGERASLERFGVASYVSPAACRTAPHIPPKLTFDDLFAQMREIGLVFSAQQAAEALVAGQAAELSAISPDTRGLTALWYSSGTNVPYVGAGIGVPQLILETIGLDNIFADEQDGWISASWEAIAAADPDVIVLVDADWNSAEQKRRLLAGNPVTSRLDAVINQRYLVLPFPASEAGVRTVGAAADMAAQLAAFTDIR